MPIKQRIISMMSPRYLKRSHKVGARLAAYTFVFALLISLSLTGFQLWQSRQSETLRIHQLLDQLTASSETHLADVVWEDDQRRAQQIAENMLKLTDVSYVMVRSQDAVLTEIGVSSRHMIERTVALSSRHGERVAAQFGAFTLGVDMASIDARLRAGYLGILARTTLLICLNIGVVLLLFKFMVTRHLSHISQFFASLTPATLEQLLRLERSPSALNAGDEFDDLVDGINHMQASLASDSKRRDQAEAEVRQLNEVLEKRVAERTSELIEKNKQLEQLAVTDRLTGLYNRLKLDQVLDDELSRSRRYASSFALVLLDVDHFKSVNDTFGHPVGDQVLVEVARLLANGTRDVDVVGRWGGEEFLVICRDTEFDGAVVLAEKLRHTVAAHVFAVVGNKTASIGVTVVRTGDTIPLLMARADKALYRGKKNGRNRVEWAA